MKLQDICLEKFYFMDIAGIGMIIGRYKTANMLGGTVEMTNVKPSIEKIFEMSGVLRIIPVVKSAWLLKGKVVYGMFYKEKILCKIYIIKNFTKVTNKRVYRYNH